MIFTNYVDVWKKIIIGEKKSWVLFENGTCVILMAPEDDLEAHAKNLLKKYGPVVPGTPAGDFNVIELVNHPGWVVTGQHKDILNYVALGEIGSDERNDVAIGLLGRHKRDQDSRTLKVIFIEDKR